MPFAGRLRKRAAAWLLVTCAAWPAHALACELQVLEHRSGRALLSAPLPQATITLGFTHSVLGTAVRDRYAWREGRWWLVEERFEGEGYGLPHAAQPGETLERDGDGWRLRLNREVHPLVVRPLPAQRMRVELDDGRAWPLGSLSTTQAVELRAVSCAAGRERGSQHPSHDG